jgi:Kef-type K+ transport system membrane component KefB
MKKSSRLTGLVLMLVGAMVLLNNLGKPRVEALHVPDVLGLVAAGMLLGIGFVGLMGRLDFAKSTKDQS